MIISYITMLMNMIVCLLLFLLGPAGGGGAAPRSADEGRDVTFIPMPMPKTLCITCV